MFILLPYYSNTILTIKKHVLQIVNTANVI